MEYEFIGKSMLVENKILAIADVHLGYEETLNEQGIFVIKGKQYEETILELDDVFSELKKRKIKLEKIVILGDLKHSFGMITDQEWRDTLNFLDFIKKNCKEIIIVKGNHDNILEPIIKKREIKLRDYFIYENIAFMHGDKEYIEVLDKKIKTWIIGHFHPAIVISDRYKKESYKCFLVGKKLGKKVIIVPSFIPIVIGKEIEHDENFGIKLDLKNFEVYAVGDKIYDFGKLKNLRKLI